MSKKTLQLVACAFALLSLVGNLQAVPTQVVHLDDANCDPLFIPLDVDEIGEAAIFPPGEQLDHSLDQPTSMSACIQSDNFSQLNEVVNITNLTGRPLTDVWYVAGPETRISNYDGFADDAGFPLGPNNRGQYAFRIDSVGLNQPLIQESGPVDDIWQPGETWRFILQDYVNFAGVAADAFDSIGVGLASAPIPGGPQSSGSIIALPIPEPTSLGLGCFAMILAGASSRRFRSRVASDPGPTPGQEADKLRGKTKVFAAVTAIVLVSASSAQATPMIVVEDTFSRTGSLLGSSTDTGHVWTGSGAFTTNGSEMIVDSNNAPRIAGLTFLPNKMYDLSMELSVNSGGFDWIAFGYTDDPAVNAFFASPAVMHHRQQPQVETFTTSSMQTINLTSNNFPKTLNIILQTGATLSNSTVTFMVDGNIVGTPSTTNASSIDAIFVQANGATGTVDNFTLTCMPIPEPSSWLLGVLGTVAFGLVRRS